jgi:hypothetical protein
MIADYFKRLGGFDITSLQVMPHVKPVDTAEAVMRLFSAKLMPTFI